MSKYKLEIPPGPWGTIYLDPPWELLTPGVRRKIHYDRMSHGEIVSLPIRDVLDSNGHIWLWTTNAHLPDALTLLPIWGVEYRGIVTWCKPKMGLGWWLRSQTEQLIFATRSKNNRRNAGSWTTVVHAPTSIHSAKPNGKIVPMIEALSPGPYLEIFARQKRMGWTCLSHHVNPPGPIW